MRLALALLVLCAGCRHDLPASDARRSDLADGPRALEPRGDGPVVRDADSWLPDAPPAALVQWSEEETCGTPDPVGWGIDCRKSGSAIIALGSPSPSPSDCSLTGVPVRYVGCPSGSISGLISTGTTCTTSEQLIGGRCACESPYHIRRSAPADGTWSCDCGGGFPGTGSANCVPKSAVPGLVFVSDHVVTNANGTNVVAECAPGETLVTGGCESAFGLQASVPFWDGTRWSGWRCLASSSQALTAKIVCAK